jgi:hypothetical protein
MVLGRAFRLSVAGAALLTCMGSHAVAQRDNGALTAIKMIEAGQWQLKDGEDGGVRKLCITNPSVLLQIRHGAAQCSHFVVENSPLTATVNYTCPGHGSGRTTVSVETPRLITVDTQGVIDGTPFSEDFEGRRVGTCG